jgi:hypothetical protein
MRAAYGVAMSRVKGGDWFFGFVVLVIGTEVNKRVDTGNDVIFWVSLFVAWLIVSWDL